MRARRGDALAHPGRGRLPLGRRWRRDHRIDADCALPLRVASRRTTARRAPTKEDRNSDHVPKDRISEQIDQNSCLFTYASSSCTHPPKGRVSSRSFITGITLCLTVTGSSRDRGFSAPVSVPAPAMTIHRLRARRSDPHRVRPPDPSPSPAPLLPAPRSVRPWRLQAVPGAPPCHRSRARPCPAPG